MMNLKRILSILLCVIATESLPSEKALISTQKPFVDQLTIKKATSVVPETKTQKEATTNELTKFNSLIHKNDISSINTMLQTTRFSETQKYSELLKSIQSAQALTNTVTKQTVLSLVNNGFCPTQPTLIREILYSSNKKFNYNNLSQQYNNNFGINAVFCILTETCKAPIWPDIASCEKLVNTKNIASILTEIERKKSYDYDILVPELLKTKAAQNNSEFDATLAQFAPSTYKSKMLLLSQAIEVPEKLKILLNNKNFILDIQKELPTILQIAATGATLDYGHVDVKPNLESVKIILETYNIGLNNIDYVPCLTTVLDSCVNILTDSEVSNKKTIRQSLVLIKNTSNQPQLISTIAALLAKNKKQQINSNKTFRQMIYDNMHTLRAECFMDMLPTTPTRWILINSQGLADTAQNPEFTKRLLQYNETAQSTAKELNKQLGNIKDLSNIVMEYYGCSLKNLE